jgi:hypothetical protein
MKHLHKFYNHADLSRVKLTWVLYDSSALPPARPREILFWCRDCLKVLLTFKNIVVCTFVQGNSIMLWKDKWADEPLRETWPHLFSFAKNDSISLKEAIDITDLKEAIVDTNLSELEGTSKLDLGGDEVVVTGGGDVPSLAKAIASLLQLNIGLENSFFPHDFVHMKARRRITSV